MTESIRDRDLARQMWHTATTRGKAGHRTMSGLAIATYIRDDNRTVRYGRTEKYPSLLETQIYNAAFGVPETAEFYSYRTGEFWVKQFTWNEK
jgi:hypothetical protein